MQAVAYQIRRQDNNEILIEGIVRDSEDTIYPSQDESYLLEEFPDLPSQVELHHFKVKGLVMETKNFTITWKQLLELPKAVNWWD
jgi:hypothetical protein